MPKKRHPKRTKASSSGLGIGAHVSIAKGGFSAAYERAREADFDAFQIFTSSPRSRKRRAITEKELKEYQALVADNGQLEIYVHTPYYVNASSPDSRIWHFSKTYILRELEVMDRANIKYFVMHVGSHKGEGIPVGVKSITRMIKEVLAESKGSKTVICLENTAGQKNEVGSDLEVLGGIMKSFKGEKRVSVIIDTCHLFSAGYDLRTPKAVETTFKLIDKHIGWERVPMLHFNDSKTKLAGGHDRHEHIGKGYIGAAGMQAVVASKYIQGKDLILETAEDGREADIAWLRKAVQSA